MPIRVAGFLTEVGTNPAAPAHLSAQHDSAGIPHNRSYFIDPFRHDGLRHAHSINAQMAMNIPARVQ